jgi:hypothetical protein
VEQCNDALAVARRNKITQDMSSLLFRFDLGQFKRVLLPDNA